MGTSISGVLPSEEMKRYAATGRCPYCGVQILASGFPISTVKAFCAYVPPRALLELPSTKARRLEAEARQRQAEYSLAPYGAQVLLNRIARRMTCLKCHKTWHMWQQLQLRSNLGQTGTPTPQTSSAPKIQAPINLTNSRVLAITEDGREERAIEVERHPFSNTSRTSLATRTFEISKTVERQAQVEFSRSTTRGGEAALTAIGIGSAVWRIQQQLGERYSLTTGSAITVRESVSIEVKPMTASELIIRWKLIYARGKVKLATGLLGSGIMNVPYLVPIRLIFVPEVRDLPRGDP
ncbi:hypothetical protein YWIDRAFT_01145 [Streptomyces sp. SceaMP-e96]|nr:hypothetical protein YWIDRAFT_01145 [Streptomyces sp. SceaMP-e96]